MPKGSPELTNARKEEIISVCETLYKTMSFKEITIKEIANFTSFTRTSIYNYFETKEEIFLALLTREYELWTDALQKIISDNETLSADEFSQKIAHSLEERQQLLKILSMNHYDLEENSREENLIEMKRAYKKSIVSVEECLLKFFMEMPKERITNFRYTFFPFMFGIYPYAIVTEKQLNAMRDAGMDYKLKSVYELTYYCVKNLLEV